MECFREFQAVLSVRALALHCNASNLVPEILKHDKISVTICTSVLTPNYGGLVAPSPRDLRLCP